MEGVYYFAYVLKSELSGKHYCGSTGNLDRSLKEHNEGLVCSTKNERPWVLVYKEAFDKRSEALKREMFFKSINGYIFLKQKGVL